MLEKDKQVNLIFLTLKVDFPFLLDLLFSLYVVSDLGFSLNHGKIITPICALVYSCVE